MTSEERVKLAHPDAVCEIVYPPGATYVYYVVWAGSDNDRKRIGYAAHFRRAAWVDAARGLSKAVKP